MSATVGLGVEQCPEEPSLFRRPGTTLIFELRQDDFHVSGINVELAWLQEHLGARLKLKLAEPMGPGSQCSYLRATRTRVDVDTIHIAPRETYIKNVLDILGLGDKGKSMPTPMVTKRSQDWVLGRTAQDRVSNIARVHEGSRCQNVYRAEESEYCAAVATTAEALHLQRLLELLGMPVKLPMATRFNGSTRHHPTTGVWS